MSYIVRTYPDAGFIFDINKQRSFFAEGTASQLVEVFTKDIDSPLPEAFLAGIPQEYLEDALADADFLRQEIRRFLDGKEDHVTSEDTERYGNAETPFQKLVSYGVKKWIPINASIEVSYRCNLNCRFCYLSNHSDPGMSRGELLAIGQELRNVGTAFVMFSGGEALLRPDIHEVLADYHQLGFALELKTNGTLMDLECIERLSLLNIYNIQVSIYDIETGPSPIVRGKYDFETLASNIRAACRAGLPVGLAVLVGKHNIDKLDLYHDVLTLLGVDDIFYSPYITPNRRGGRGFESEVRLTAQEMEEKLLPFLERIDGLIKPVKYRERCGEGPICFAGRDQIAISPDGTVSPCLDFQLPLGNLRLESLEEVLARREQILSSYKLSMMPKCLNCKISEYCDSCPGIALLENGDYVTPVSHKCDVSQFYFRSLLAAEEV